MIDVVTEGRFTLARAQCRQGLSLLPPSPGPAGRAGGRPGCSQGGQGLWGRASGGQALLGSVLTLRTAGMPHERSSQVGCGSSCFGEPLESPLVVPEVRP